jgi:hypothetical protein
MTESPEEAAEMTLEEFNHEISKCNWGFENGGSTQGRKAFFKRLVWLEKQRESCYGIEAPIRRFRDRS